MDEQLLRKMEQKIQETISKRDEIRRITESLSNAGCSESFAMGVMVGRLYNAFYYQSKRVLGREPTSGEVDEFLKFVKGSGLEGLW